MNKEIKKLLVLCGKSASGKDTILKELQKQYGYNSVISHTTRPKRDNEQDGVDYHFVDVNTFSDMVNNDEFVEWRCYHTKVQDKEEDWFYGVSVEEIQNKENPVVIVTLEGLAQLMAKYGRENIFSVYVYIDLNERINRAENRPNFDKTEWARRCKADNNDFTVENVLELCDICLKNDNLNDVVKRIKQLHLVFENE